MGDYNADKTPMLQQAQYLARNSDLISGFSVMTDQWTIDATHRVNSFRDGTGNIKVKILSDPTVYPL